jgi:hypothetical protein
MGVSRGGGRRCVRVCGWACGGRHVHDGGCGSCGGYRNSRWFARCKCSGGGGGGDGDGLDGFGGLGGFAGLVSRGVDLFGTPSANEFFLDVTLELVF